MCTVFAFEISAGSTSSMQHWTTRILYVGPCPATKQADIRGSCRGGNVLRLPGKECWLCFSLNFKICQALLYSLRTGIHGPTGPTRRASLAYLASAECCPPMQKFLDQQKVLSPFMGKPSTNQPGLRGWQSGLHLCITLPKIAVDA